MRRFSASAAFAPPCRGFGGTLESLARRGAQRAAPTSGRDTDGTPALGSSGGPFVDCFTLLHVPSVQRGGPQADPSPSDIFTSWTPLCRQLPEFVHLVQQPLEFIGNLVAMNRVHYPGLSERYPD